MPDPSAVDGFTTAEFDEIGIEFTSSPRRALLERRLAAAVAQASPTAAAQAAAVQAAAASSGGAPGKARSSMSLQLMSGR